MRQSETAPPGPARGTHRAGRRKGRRLSNAQAYESDRGLRAQISEASRGLDARCPELAAAGAVRGMFLRSSQWPRARQSGCLRATATREAFFAEQGSVRAARGWCYGVAARPNSDAPGARCASADRAAAGRSDTSAALASGANCSVTPPAKRARASSSRARCAARARLGRRDRRRAARRDRPAAASARRAGAQRRGPPAPGRAPRGSASTSPSRKVVRRRALLAGLECAESPAAAAAPRPERTGAKSRPSRPADGRRTPSPWTERSLARQAGGTRAAPRCRPRQHDTTRRARRAIITGARLLPAMPPRACNIA